MSIMAVCGLGYDELKKAIESRECWEAERVGDSPLNKHSIIFRNGGVSYCYSRGCPHSLKRSVKIEFNDIYYRLNLSKEEEAFVKRMRWEFLLDEDYVFHNSFIPAHDPLANGYSVYTYGSCLPFRPQSIFGEVGDIRVYEDYDEMEEGYNYLPPPKTEEWLEKLSGRGKLALERFSKRKHLIKREWDTDRFLTVDEYELEENSCHCGVIIKHPKNTPFKALDMAFQKSRLGVLTDYIERELPPKAESHIAHKLDEEQMLELRENPTKVREILLENRVYLSQFHPKQTKLEVVIP